MCVCVLGGLLGEHAMYGESNVFTKVLSDLALRECNKITFLCVVRRSNLFRNRTGLSVFLTLDKKKVAFEGGGGGEARQMKF